MKKLIFLTSLCFLAIILIISCNKKKTINDPQANGSIKKKTRVQYNVYYANWDGWGRISRNCHGWGLCNFQDCWFCCTDNAGNIIDCPKEELIANGGTIYIPVESNEGFMEIKLNPDYSEQQDAITNELTLYLDNDIIGENFILRQGEYEFTSTIGQYGGYSILVTKK